MGQRPFFNLNSGGVGGPGGEGHCQGTGGNGGTGEGPIQHHRSKNSTVINFNCISAKGFTVFYMIAIVIGIIAYTVRYLDFARSLTDSQRQISSFPVSQVNQIASNCPPPSRIFHGRQNILDKMHKYFSQNQMQQCIFLLYGVGGAGKTQIARMFIQASSRFSDRFYIDASTQDTIDAGMKNIALNKAGNTSQDALDWLHGNHDQWLLFFDNADDPDIDLNPFLPQCDHGNIIITSRNPGLRFYAGSDARVSDMEETDAVKLLLACASQEVTPRNKEMATEIVQELSYLPLAIVQAGAFIAESGALNTYLRLYRQNRKQLLGKKPAQSHDGYGRTVHTTWQMSFDNLSELAQTFLQLCSFLHNQGISEKIFSQASVYEFSANSPSKEELQKPVEFLSQYLGPFGDWDSLRFTEVTSQLQAYSLIEFNTVTGLFSIHPLVHSWSQSTLTDPEMYHYSMVAIVGMAITAISPKTDMQLVRQLVPHIDALRKGQTPMTPDFNLQYSSIYYYAGRYNKSVELESIYLEKLRGWLGEDHSHTLKVMGNLASTYSLMGQFKRAEELAAVVLKKKQDILGETHLDTLHAMGNLAWIYRKIGRLNKAEELEDVALKRLQHIVGVDCVNTLLPMVNQAFICGQLGQDDYTVIFLGGNILSGNNQCTDFGIEFTAVIAEKFVTCLPLIIESVATYCKLSQFKRAEGFEEVFFKKQPSVDEDHPDTLHAMANLAVACSKLGQFKQAEELEVDVFKMQQDTLGKDHPDTLLAMENLAWTYQKSHQLSKAVELRAMVLKNLRNIYGEDHLDTLLAMANLALTYSELGQFEQAEALELVVLKKRQEILGEDHPDTLVAMENLAWTYQIFGQLSKTEELETVVLKQRQDTLGEDHPDTLLAMANLAVTYSKLGQFKQAEVLEDVVLQKRQDILGEDHPDTLISMQNLAATYNGLGKFKEAEALRNAVLKKQHRFLFVM
ncbi:FabD/lysophospholipase-like protein [Mycena venus]|uniref:FabD/lysophospholipase-like protein n=1 Tax=Mycena venus TaxID=2733690 RepID=A0A8H6WSP8_9AGAR|nr:FabD/lysophospholipase-like protein [Mycena venus]